MQGSVVDWRNIRDLETPVASYELQVLRQAKAILLHCINTISAMQAHNLDQQAGTLPEALSLSYCSYENLCSFFIVPLNYRCRLFCVRDQGSVFEQQQTLYTRTCSNFHCSLFWCNWPPLRPRTNRYPWSQWCNNYLNLWKINEHAGWKH